MTTYSAVRTTGIYCRPGCGAKPLAENVETFELAAAAEAAGYRACLRCRPYRVAGTVADDAPELVCRAVQLIIYGVLDEAGEAALGARLGVSARHLRRMFHEYLGVTPDGFARSRRAHFARRLLDDTELSVADVAFASGFGSLRQFNRTMREVFQATPREMRDRRRRGNRLAADGGLTLRMPFTPPYDWEAMSGFLAAHAIPGVESVEGGVYRRTISLDGAPGMLEIGPGGADHLLLRAHLPYWEGVIHVVERAARLVGLEVQPVLAVRQLAADPVVGPLIAARPGIRVPGAWAPFEVATGALVRALPGTGPGEGPLVRALSGTGPGGDPLVRRSPVTTRAAPASRRYRSAAAPLPAPTRGGAAAAGLLRRLVEVCGVPVAGLGYGLEYAFPSAETVMGSELPEELEPVRELARRVAVGNISLDEPGVLPERVAQFVAMRLGVRDACPVEDAPESWRPWRALASAHLLTAELLT